MKINVCEIALSKSLCFPGPFVQEKAGIGGNASQQNPGRTELRQGMLGSGGDWRAGDSQQSLALVFSTQLRAFTSLISEYPL